MIYLRTCIILIDLIVAIAAVYYVVRSIRRRAKLPNPNTDLPRCANCRYALVGHTSAKCPECGRDVLAGGVIAPSRQLLPNLWLLLAWTAALAIALLALNRFSPYHLRQEAALYISNYTPSVHAPKPADPTWSTKAVMTLKGQETRWTENSSATIFLDGDLLIERPRGDIRIEFFGGARRYRFSTMATSYPFDKAILISQIQSLGVDVNNPDVLKQAEILVDDAFYVFGLTTLDSGSWAAGRTESPWFVHTALGKPITVIEIGFFIFPFGAILWVYGALRLPRARRIVHAGEAAELISAAVTPAK